MSGAVWDSYFVPSLSFSVHVRLSSCRNSVLPLIFVLPLYVYVRLFLFSFSLFLAIPWLSLSVCSSVLFLSLFLSVPRSSVSLSVRRSFVLSFCNFFIFSTVVYFCSCCHSSLFLSIPRLSVSLCSVFLYFFFPSIVYLLHSVLPFLSNPFCYSFPYSILPLFT